MTRNVKRTVMGVILGMLAIAMVAGLGFAFVGQPAANANAASLAQTSTTTPSTTAKAKNAEGQKLASTYAQSFASSLGVNQTQLNTAYSAAISATVQQAVQDGKLTQTQANNIAAKAQKKGFTGSLALRGKNAKHAGAKVAKDALNAAASAVGISTTELRSDLKNGQTIAQVAQAHNKDLQTVETAIVSSIKTQLDTALKNGKITQAQHDKALANAQTRVSKLVNRQFKHHTHAKKANTTTSTSTAQ